MTQYTLPDYLLCLGGGGIGVGQTFMTQDWILEEAILGDPEDDHGPPGGEQRSLHAFFVDTDTSTELYDLADEIQATVESIVDRHGVQYPPDIDGTIVDMAQGDHEQYLTPENLTNGPIVEELMDALNLGAWWISDDSVTTLQLLDDLSHTGVARRRGLAKAIGRVAEWNADPLAEIVRQVSAQQEPRVAMVVSLGGGTGSGLCIDLARRMKAAGATVTLFGILPAPDENQDILTNAYATLSELEYLALSNADLFRNVVLLPFGSASDRKIFDKAATYTITSFYNRDDVQGDDQFDETSPCGPPRYAPFVVGSTRYLHYPGEALEEAVEKAQHYLDRREDALEAEAELYDALKTYIVEQHETAADELFTTDGDPSFQLSADRAIPLRERLDDVHTLLEADPLMDIGFSSAHDLAEEFEELQEVAREQAERDAQRDRDSAIARKLIPLLAQHVDDVEAFEPDEGWAPDEREFVDQIRREFELVARRAGMFRALEAIEAEGGIVHAHTVATDIRNALDEGYQGFTAEVENELERVHDEIRTLEEASDRLEEAIRAANDSIEELQTEWVDSVQQKVERYYELVDQSDQIETLLHELRREIEAEMRAIEEARDPGAITATGTRFDRYDELNQLLDTVGVSPVRKNVIEESVESAQIARQKQLQARNQGSLRDLLAMVTGSPTTEELRADYASLSASIDDQLVEIADWEAKFEVRAQGDYFDTRLRELEEEREGLVEEITAATESVCSAAEDSRRDLENRSRGDEVDLDIGRNETSEPGTEDVRRRIRRALADEERIESVSSGDELLSALLDGPVEDLLTAILRDPFQERLTELQDAVVDRETTARAYDDLESIVKGPGARMSRTWEEVPPLDDDVTGDVSKSDGPFRRDVTPPARGELVNSDDLGDTQLWNDESEQIRSELRDIHPHLGDEYLPIDERYIADGDTHQIDYEGHRLSSVFMSPLFEGYEDDETAKIPEVTEDVVDDRQFGEGEYLAARGEFADSYDVATSTFLGGVFLDNLRLFTDEYRRAYRRRTDVESGTDRHNHLQEVPSVVEHHAYGIDGVSYHDEAQFLPEQSDGGFCHRRDVLDLEADGTEVLLDQAEDEVENEERVVETLLNEYYEIVGYPSTIDRQ